MNICNRCSFRCKIWNNILFFNKKLYLFEIRSSCICFFGNTQKLSQFTKFVIRNTSFHCTSELHFDSIKSLWNKLEIFWGDYNDTTGCHSRNEQLINMLYKYPPLSLVSTMVQCGITCSKIRGIENWNTLYQTIPHGNVEAKIGITYSSWLYHLIPWYNVFLF